MILGTPAIIRGKVKIIRGSPATSIPESLMEYELSISSSRLRGTKQPHTSWSNAHVGLLRSSQTRQMFCISQNGGDILPGNLFALLVYEDTNHSGGVWF